MSSARRRSRAAARGGEPVARGDRSREVVGARPQRALDARPADRRVLAIEVRVAAEEAVARVLLLDGALGDADVRLGGDAATDVRDVHAREPSRRAPCKERTKICDNIVHAVNNPP